VVFQERSPYRVGGFKGAKVDHPEAKCCSGNATPLVAAFSADGDVGTLLKKSTLRARKSEPLGTATTISMVTRPRVPK
jgi:hypothetical protein